MVTVYAQYNLYNHHQNVTQVTLNLKNKSIFKIQSVLVVK